MKLQHKIRTYLSHRPALYALIVGIGIVLFWRGVWHSVDQFHTYLEHFSSTSLVVTPWWDGPVSFLIGSLVLWLTGAFTSSFIGNELILSGLRGEKRLNQRTEEELKDEVAAIADIKGEIDIIAHRLESLQKQVHSNHTKL